MPRNQESSKKPAYSGLVLLFTLGFSPRFSNWVHQFFNRYFFVVVEKTIPSSAANFAGSNSFVDVGIFLREFMTFLTMRLGAFFVGMGFYCFENICSGVKRLLAFCSPSAISRFVRAIVINPVNRHAGRPITHVGIKGFERIAPFIANVNASASVVLPIWSIRIGASLDHVSPSVVHGLKPFISHKNSIGCGAYIVNDFNGEYYA